MSEPLLRVVMRHTLNNLTAVGFEPTQLALVELESTPLDHSGKLSWAHHVNWRGIGAAGARTAAAKLLRHCSQVGGARMGCGPARQYSPRA